MNNAIERTIAINIIKDIFGLYNLFNNDAVIDDIVKMLIEYRSAAPEKKMHEKGEKVDYDTLYDILKHQPITYKIIKDVTGLKTNEILQVIDTLSLSYPVYSPGRGIYELLREEE
jgi:predicted Rossmann fold nucleotide-binding protein DprA/Smf involved in DNA uptake